MTNTAHHRFFIFLNSLNILLLGAMISCWFLEILYGIPRSIFLPQIFFLVPIFVATIPCFFALRKSAPRILSNASAAIFFQVLLMILGIPLFWVFIRNIGNLQWPLFGISSLFALIHELLTRYTSIYQKQHWYSFGLLFAQIAIATAYYLVFSPALFQR